MLRPSGTTYLYTVVQWVFAQDRKSHGSRGAQVLRLQLHLDPFDAEPDASDGAGVTNRLWDVADLVNLLIESESEPPLERTLFRLTWALGPWAQEESFVLFH